MRQERKLSTRECATLTKPGRHSDGGGLYLNIIKGARSWVYLFDFDKRQREMGLGSYPQVSLASARQLRDHWRAELIKGHNPITLRKGIVSAPKTFGACATEYLATKSPEWRNAKHKSQWRRTLEVHMAPLNSLPVDKVDTEAVLGVLKPLWQAIPETAPRIRGRIEQVLDFAKARGWRSGENPAAWRGHLALILPGRQKIARNHYAAMAYENVPEFMARIAEDSCAAAALQFAILTAARTNEVLGARWDEIDLGNRIWMIPANRMKSGRNHRIPLSCAAMRIVDSSTKVGEYVFPGRYIGRAMSGKVLAQLLKRTGIADATVHGFRSSFRDWAGNETSFPREIAEAALAHAVGNSTEASYRRSDALERRRALMEAWSKFCESGGTNVVPLRAVG